MTDAKLRVGILGAARIARKNAIAIGHSESGCIVTAVSSRTHAKAEVRGSFSFRSNCKVHTGWRDVICNGTHTFWLWAGACQGLCENKRSNDLWWR